MDPDGASAPNAADSRTPAGGIMTAVGNSSISLRPGVIRDDQQDDIIYRPDCESLRRPQLMPSIKEMAKWYTEAYAEAYAECKSIIRVSDERTRQSLGDRESFAQTAAHYIAQRKVREEMWESHLDSAASPSAAGGFSSRLLQER